MLIVNYTILGRGAACCSRYNKKTTRRYESVRQVVSLEKNIPLSNIKFREQETFSESFLGSARGLLFKEAPRIKIPNTKNIL